MNTVHAEQGRWPPRSSCIREVGKAVVQKRTHGLARALKEGLAGMKHVRLDAEHPEYPKEVERALAAIRALA